MIFETSWKTSCTKLLTFLSLAFTSRQSLTLSFWSAFVSGQSYIMKTTLNLVSIYSERCPSSEEDTGLQSTVILESATGLT